MQKKNSWKNLNQIGGNVMLIKKILLMLGYAKTNEVTNKLQDSWTRHSRESFQIETLKFENTRLKDRLLSVLDENSELNRKLREMQAKVDEANKLVARRNEDMSKKDQDILKLERMILDRDKRLRNKDEDVKKALEIVKKAKDNHNLVLK